MILHAREKSHEYDDIKDQNDRPWNLKCTKLFDKLRVIYKKMDYHLVTNLRIKKVSAYLFFSVCDMHITWAFKTHLR